MTVLQNQGHFYGIVHYYVITMAGDVAWLSIVCSESLAN